MSQNFKVGLYNKTHSTSNHGGLKRGDMTKAEQDLSYPVDSKLKSHTSSGSPSGPVANLSPELEPAIPVETSNSTHVDIDPDGLEFSSESAFLAEVLDDGDCDVWMAATSNTDGLDFNAPVAPELLAVDNSSSSSKEYQHLPAFGECMFCHARGFEYTLCSECDNIFHPIQDSSPDDDSSVIHEEHEEPDPALSHVRSAMMGSFNTDRITDNDTRNVLASFGPHRATSAQDDFLASSGPHHATSGQDDNSQVVMEEESEQVRAASATLVLNAFNHPSLDLTNNNSTTSEYMPTYFDYFDTVSDAPSCDPLSSFMDSSPCSSLLSDDDFSYQLDVDNSLDDDDSGFLYFGSGDFIVSSFCFWNDVPVHNSLNRTI